MNRRFCCTALLCALAPLHAADPFAEGVRTTDPLTPEAQQETFRLPPGFEIQLVAAEPDIQKPMNMAFDHKGRLWVTMSREYPYPAPLDKPARDSIRILEDFDENGRARKITTFVEGLNIPIGIYPYKDGVIAWSIPNIWFFRDTDGDGKADKREVLYGPFGWERDTHGNQASFRRGFDGWLYATHGFNNISEVTARDGSTVKMHSGHTYRMAMDGETIQHHTFGQVNPFGLCFDPAGNMYSADCHSAPIYELLRGAYYPSFGKPHDGLGFGPTMLEHSHGSTAICGIIHYTDDKWPAEFRNNIFIGNVMTSRINRDTLVEHGSTKEAREEADFLTTTDPWFRPVDLRLGPDGALYVADFYNRIIGHYEVPLDHPGRDRERARIWRVVYSGKDLEPLTDFTKAKTSELIGEFASANLARRLMVLNEVVDRGRASIPLLKEHLSNENPGADDRVTTLWALHRLGGLTDEALQAAASSKEEVVRVHAMRILAEKPELTSKQRRWAEAGLRDEAPLVQRAAADALGVHPSAVNLAPLLELRHAIPAEDAQLLHTVRMALRDQLKAGHYPAASRKEAAKQISERDARALADVSLGVKSEAAANYLAEYLERFGKAEPKERLTDYIRHIARYGANADAITDLIRREFADDLNQQLALFRAIQEGNRQRGAELTEATGAWGEALAEALLAAHSGEEQWQNLPVPGRPPSANPWFLQERNSEDGRSATFVCSLPPGGEHLTGILRSEPFEVPARLEFYMAGHDGLPGKPAQGNNLVRLVETESGRVLAEAGAPRNDTAHKVSWELGKAGGTRAHLELVDADTGNAYAWIAVGRFHPAVVALPKVDPRGNAEQLKAAAELAKSLQAESLAPKLRELVLRENLDFAARAALADALAVLMPGRHKGALAVLAGDASITPALRHEICRAIAGEESLSPEKLLVEAMSAAPSRAQLKLAQMLAGNPEGAQALMAMIERGEASPQLLLDNTVKNKMGGIDDPALQKQLKHFQDILPPVDAAKQQQIQEVVSRYNPGSAQPTRGAAVFVKNCAVCHQVDGTGALVGPQLDGIGNRGLERLVEDTLDPNRNVDVNFRTEIVVLEDGDVLTGLIRREEGDTVVLADSTGKETSVTKASIERRRTSETSLMPSNFGDVLTPEELQDLLAFLLSKGAQAGQ